MLMNVDDVLMQTEKGSKLFLIGVVNPVHNCARKVTEQITKGENMTRMTRAEEERIIEAIVNTIVDYDAPNWVRDIVRNELRKQRGLTEKKQAKKKPEKI